MFGQDNNQDSGQAANDLFAPEDTTTNNAAVPAPGAPAGPVNQDHSSPFDAPVADNTPTPTAVNVGVNDDLLDIKQDALQALTPLVGHLEQSPEEKFKTTMMMIQASDDQSLIKEAYEAAQKINDEKARAQALLDVVNEINYFTQHHSN